ncbi:MAG: hypothetical protein H0W02_02765 [Ktedonobacteraceae bacterium]|nr:hypothetical protein [Ktedonobacteraceae bacterium]
MGKIYYLDLATLMSVLDDGLYTLSTSLVVSGTQGSGYITLSNGHITECAVKLADGRHIEGEQAFRLLQSQTQWQVQIVPVPPALPPMPPATPAMPPSYRDTLPPSMGFSASPPGILRQKRILDPALLEGFTMKQRLMLRTVLTMVNGQRTAEQIKEHVNLPARTVEEVLETLHALGIIE